MYSFIFGFQRFVWCPKWTPASRSSFIETSGVVVVGFGVVVKYGLLIQTRRPVWPPGLAGLPPRRERQARDG
jgi:hypothetical protein